MNDDGSISGLANDEMTDLDTGFSDDKLCSDSCFWRKANRAGLEVTPWAHEDRELFQALLPAYVHNKRAACMIALAVRKSCVEVRLLPSRHTMCADLIYRSSPRSSSHQVDQLASVSKHVILLQCPNGRAQKGTASTGMSIRKHGSITIDHRFDLAITRALAL